MFIMDKLKMSNSRFDTVTWSTDSLMSLHEKYRIKYYDRPSSETILSEQQQYEYSEIIENMLIRLPMPHIYLLENNDGDYEVIRGREKMVALYMCMENLLEFTGLRYYPEENGQHFTQLPKPLQRRISEYNWSVVILRLQMENENAIDAIDRIKRIVRLN